MKLKHDGARPVGFPERIALRLGQPTREFHWQSTKVGEFFLMIMYWRVSIVRCVVYTTASVILRVTKP